MELFAFGIFAGMIFALMFFCVWGAFRNDENVDQGKSNDDNNVQSSSDAVSELSGGSSDYIWTYDKGSEKEKEELGCLIDGLYAIALTGGLTSYEKRIIKKIIGYAERDLGDD